MRKRPDAPRSSLGAREARARKAAPREETAAALYAVLIEQVPGTREAQALVATLREQGFPDAVEVFRLVEARPR